MKLKGPAYYGRPLFLLCGGWRVERQWSVNLGGRYVVDYAPRVQGFPRHQPKSTQVDKGVT
jgi:hypothetical protein